MRPNDTTVAKRAYRAENDPEQAALTEFGLQVLDSPETFTERRLGSSGR